MPTLHSIPISQHYFSCVRVGRFLVVGCVFYKSLVEYRYKAIASVVGCMRHRVHQLYSRHCTEYSRAVKVTSAFLR